MLLTIFPICRRPPPETLKHDLQKLQGTSNSPVVEVSEVSEILSGLVQAHYEMVVVTIVASIIIVVLGMIILMIRKMI